MRNYIVTDPNGNEYEISAHENATDEDIINHAHQYLSKGINPPEYLAMGDVMNSADRAAYYQATGERISGDESGQQYNQPRQVQQPTQQQSVQQQQQEATYSREDERRFTEEHNRQLEEAEARARQQVETERAGGQAALNQRLKKLGY